MLTDDYAKCPAEPPSFINTTLFEHQRTVVQALLDLENSRSITVNPHKVDLEKYTEYPVSIETNAMVLAERFGSGKTIEILAFIAFRPIPRALPTKLPSGAGNPSFSKMFVGRASLIRPNAIIVGPSVSAQWLNTINERTTMRCFMVDCYANLKKFADLYRSGRLNTYNIVIIRNAVASGSFDFMSDEGRRQENMIDAVSKITADSCWSRVFYDDFDVISIPYSAKCLNALFSVYVSSTKNIGKNHRDYVRRTDSIEAALNDMRPTIMGALCDVYLFKTFKICCDKRYIDASMQLPFVNAYVYTYENPIDNYVNLLYAMDTDDARAMTEMINGDAMNTAAETLGIKSNSIADIFQKILDKKYAVYKRDFKILGHIQQLLEAAKSLPVGEPEWGECRLALLRGELPQVYVSSPEFTEHLESLRAEFAKKTEEDLLPITRVIDNIKEGECQICRMPLGDFDVFILRCCGLIVCDMCAIRGNKIQKRRIDGADVYQGLCGNCMKPVNPLTDLVFVDKEFDIGTVLGSCDAIPDDGAVFEEPPAPSKECNVSNPKHRALIDICSGRTPENGQEFDLNIEGMVQGIQNNYAPADQPRKVILFANYHETLEGYEQLLDDFGIKHLRLCGTYREKAVIVRDFEHMTSGVLVINSQETCAGLNLQCATDVVFAHKVLNRAVESQSIGRAQRCGRKYNLRVHFLTYAGEARLAF